MADHSTHHYTLDVAGIKVVVQRKRIRHLYLRVIAPQGQVRVSASLQHTDADIERVVTERFAWIERQQARLAERERQMPTTPSLVEGEPQWFLGLAYPLRLTHPKAGQGITLSSNAIHMAIAADAKTAAKRHLLDQWYRIQIKNRLPALLDDWTATMNVTVKQWRVRRMKTLWGSCNPIAQRIWLNLDLIRHPPECLEYVLVHELVHLLERGHNARFYAFMDHFLPDWRLRRRQLNGLSHQASDQCDL